MLDVIRTRDKNAYFVFTLELMASLTAATYQLGVADDSNEKKLRTLNLPCSNGNEQHKRLYMRI